MNDTVLQKLVLKSLAVARSCIYSDTNIVSVNGFGKHSIFALQSTCWPQSHITTAFSRRKFWRVASMRDPVFVKRILVKLSKAKLAKTSVGKSGGYGLARSPKNISLLDIYSAVNPPDTSAIHTYPVN